MTPRMESDLEFSCKNAYSVCAQLLLILARMLAKLGSDLVALLWGQLFNTLGDLMDHARHTTRERSQIELLSDVEPGIGTDVVGEPLKIFPPETVRTIKRCAADEKPGWKPSAPKGGSGDIDVGRQIVVERDCDGERFSRAPLKSSLGEPRRGNDTIVLSQMIELRLEDVGVESRHQLVTRIPCWLSDSVVHERDA